MTIDELLASLEAQPTEKKEQETPAPSQQRERESESRFPMSQEFLAYCDSHRK